MRILEEKKSTKQVEYHGVALQVPNWAKWLAADSGGRVYAYECVSKPKMHLDPSRSYWVCTGGSDDDIGIVAVVDLEGLDWKDSLVEVGE